MELTILTVFKCTAQWHEVRFSLLCNHSRSRSPELFHLHKPKPCTHETTASRFLLPPVTGIHHSTFPLCELDLHGPFSHSLWGAEGFN